MPVRKPPARKARGNHTAVTVKPPARRPARRTSPRVEGDEPASTAGAVRERVTRNVTATAKVVDGEVLIIGQIAEKVPVAQFANVEILSGFQWKLGGINMEDLIDVEWGDIDGDEDSDTYGESTFDYSAMTPRQQVAYDRIMGARRATMKVLEHGTAEDRETVERSVRMHNERLAEEEAAEAKAENAKRQRRRASS